MDAFNTATFFAGLAALAALGALWHAIRTTRRGIHGEKARLLTRVTSDFCEEAQLGIGLFDQVTRGKEENLRFKAIIRKKALAVQFASKVYYENPAAAQVAELVQEYLKLCQDQVDSSRRRNGPARAALKPESVR